MSGDIEDLSSAGAVSAIPYWQRLAEGVSEARLYDYLLRLSILSYQIAPRFADPVDASQQPDTIAQPTFSAKLPKGILKALRDRFKNLATAEGSDSQDLLRRSYLAFYAQILLAKSTDRALYEDLGSKPESLVVHFISCATKEIKKTTTLGANVSAEVNKQGAAFVTLLQELIKQIKPNSQLLSQLQLYKESLESSAGMRTSAAGPTRHPSGGSVSLSYSLDQMDMANHVADVMTISPSILSDDIGVMKDQVSPVQVQGELTKLLTDLAHDQHPVYCQGDFPSPAGWQEWKQQEGAAVQALVDSLGKNMRTSLENSMAGLDIKRGGNVIPSDSRSYFYSLVQQCLNMDARNSVLLSSKSQKLLGLAAQYWRISPETYASVLLHAVITSFTAGNGDIDRLNDAFNFAEHLTRGSATSTWAKSDYAHVVDDIRVLCQDFVNRITIALQKLFAEKPPKLAPYLKLLDERISELAPVDISFAQKRQLSKAITASAELKYDELLRNIPRDENLDLVYIAELGEGIINVAKRLQKRFPLPLFGDLAIAKIVCRRQIRLFINDFKPMLDYCVELYQEKNEPPTLDEVSIIYKMLLELRSLYAQVDESQERFAIDVEALLYPFVLDWANASKKLANSWVEPALEHDTFLPIDPSEIMYSSSVKDLFDSFYASIRAVQDLRWENDYHAAKLMSLIILGSSDAICFWAHKVRLAFCQEFESKLPKQQYVSRQERWLALAKEAVQQRHIEPPEPFQFKVETCVKVNDIAAAYDLFFKMEESVNSDDIARKIEVKDRKRQQAGQNTSSYLYTLCVRSAHGLLVSEGKGVVDSYVTLMDEGGRRKLGRTRTCFANANPYWNQNFEFETSARAQMIKLMVWDENIGVHHDLCGSARVKLDPKEFGNRDFGTIEKVLTLENTGRHTSTPQVLPSKLVVQVSMDKQREDIRFYFGKALRFLKQTKRDMIELIVDQFTGFIQAYISLTTIRNLLSPGKLAIDTLSSWLGKNTVFDTKNLDTEQIEDTLQPLFDYLNSNFATLSTGLTNELRLEVMMQTWNVVLRTVEGLILAPLEKQKHVRGQLSSKEMEIVYTWLSVLRDFFYNDGAGPSLEKLQSSDYQKIMIIPVYYDMPTKDLRLECEKITKTSLRTLNQKSELMQRQMTVMAHRNRKEFEKQEAMLRDMLRSSPQVDNVILRILRMRKDDSFIDKHLEYQERVELKLTTEKALQGY